MSPRRSPNAPMPSQPEIRCRVDGCGRPVRSKGLCNAHRLRLRRYGDPLAGSTPLGEPMRYLREVVLTYDGDVCLPWPYGRAGPGYGKVWVDGENVAVHRLVCENVNGPPPSPGHQAAHSCGNGHLACCTKRHLSWKTAAGNAEDRLIHGTHNRGERHASHKLTEADVLQIRGFSGKRPQSDVAKQFGVHRATIGKIMSGEHRAYG